MVVKTEPRYEHLLADLKAMLDEAKADVRAARDNAMRESARGRVHEFERAIKVIQKAETIPAVRDEDEWIADAVQFGFRSLNGSIGVPPNLLDIMIMRPIEWQEYRVVVTDPIHIATLDAAAEVGICQRVPLMSMFARRPGGGPDGTWVSAEQYRDLVRNGMAA